MEKKEGLISGRARETGKKVRKYLIPAPARKSVGGQIKKENYDNLWGDIIEGCREYKTTMSPDFMEFMCKCTIEVRNMYFPIAKSSGIEPIAFALERLKNQAKIMKSNKDWMNETDRLHEYITRETDKAIIVGIKKK